MVDAGRVTWELQMKKWVLIAGWLISLVVVFGVGANLALKGQLRAFGVKLDETQAMLAYNHLATFRELESDLANRCYEETLQKVRVSKDQEMTLLASFIKDNPNNTFILRYVSDRDPALLGQLQMFKSAYGKSAPWPQCRCQN